MKTIIINIMILISLTGNVKGNDVIGELLFGAAEIAVPFVLDEIILTEQEKKVRDAKAQRNRKKFKEFFGFGKKKPDFEISDSQKKIAADTDWSEESDWGE